MNYSERTAQWKDEEDKRSLRFSFLMTSDECPTDARPIECDMIILPLSGFLVLATKTQIKLYSCLVALGLPVCLWILLLICYMLHKILLACSYPAAFFIHLNITVSIRVAVAPSHVRIRQICTRWTMGSADENISVSSLETEEHSCILGGQLYARPVFFFSNTTTCVQSMRYA